jgi:hypothetical protein
MSEYFAVTGMAHFATGLLSQGSKADPLMQEVAWPYAARRIFECVTVH